VELEVEQTDTPFLDDAVLDNPDIDFHKLANAALHNAGINPEDRIRAA